MREILADLMAVQLFDNNSQSCRGHRQQSAGPLAKPSRTAPSAHSLQLVSKPPSSLSPAALKAAGTLSGKAQVAFIR